MAADPHRTYEIRCPVHGFISLNDWERSIIDHRAFQRLRRIRQLAWTDMVYPGGMHTRFEHSLGVMHTATLLYNAICARSSEILKSRLKYIPSGLDRDLQLVRLAALLHDVGHGPFSHAGEDLLPDRESGSGQYKHEEYSAAIVRHRLREVIEDHPWNRRNHGLTAEEVAQFLEANPKAQYRLFWRELIDGQMDADRMDYLLRDSYHLGVQYGRFDLNRVINTIEATPDERELAPRLGISEGGWHAAESLVLARYFMFTQVYYHKTRVAYDIHLRGALREMLPGGKFPKPTDGNLDEFLEWDDWRVLGLLAQGHGGEHGERLRRRDHYRRVYKTEDMRSAVDRKKLDRIKDALGDLLAAEAPASKSWYKTGSTDIPVIREMGARKAVPLSSFSSVLKNLPGHDQVMLYVKAEDREKASAIIVEVERAK
jgi:uncharacterized protein